MAAGARSKIRSRRALRALLEGARRSGRRIVFTNGCFDLLHIGHVRALEAARRLGDVLVVGVNRDRRVRELKGPGRPIVPEHQRAEVVASLQCVDHVVLFGEDTPTGLIRDLRPHVVAKGGEYRRAEPPEKRVAESAGARFVYLRQIPRARSSRLIERARRGGR
jgi:D-beta-D-heptose 7-phosphate kinase/D-beta-D-heptose 1-phosphate adenosyltransferase